MAVSKSDAELGTLFSGVEIFGNEPLPRSLIRVVDILPKSQSTSSLLECRVRVASLSREYDSDLSFIAGTEAVFTCLSYMWGNENDVEIILLNGKRIIVRRNLYNFLVYARQNNVQGPFWIDAICINQDNVSERNIQVRQMAQIYNRASKVLIWPGRMPDDLDKLVSAVNRWGVAKHGSTLTRRVGVRSALRMSSISESELHRMSTMKYWNRIWIVQEIMLAQDPYLIAGNDMIRWEEFACFVKALEAIKVGPFRPTNNGPDAGQALVTGLPLRRLTNWKEYLEKPFQNFDALLRDFKTGGCADLRDRVYGIIGILSETREMSVRYDEDTDTMIWRVAAELARSPLRSFLALVAELGIALAVHWSMMCGECFGLESQNFKTEFWPEGHVGDGKSGITQLLFYAYPMPDLASRNKCSTIASRRKSCCNCDREPGLESTCVPFARNSTSIWLQVKPESDVERDQKR